MDAYEKRISIESATKEAYYALEHHHSLAFYDCLTPELEAFRPLRLPVTKQKRYDNNVAKLEVFKKQIELVSIPSP